MVVEGLVDVLAPWVVVALGATCAALRGPMRGVLAGLQERHAAVVRLCRFLGDAGNGTAGTSYEPGTDGAVTPASLASVATLRVDGDVRHRDMEALGMVLRTRGLPALQVLLMTNRRVGDRGLCALCGGLSRPGRRAGALCPRAGRQRPRGARGPGARGGHAPRRAAAPRALARPQPGHGQRRHRGAAPALRAAKALKALYLNHCEIGDTGVAALVGLCKAGDFAALEWLDLVGNAVTDGALPRSPPRSTRRSCPGSCPATTTSPISTR